MTSADRNYDDLVPAQEKLEWVTPQMTLMGAGNTDGSKDIWVNEDEGTGSQGTWTLGPS